MDKICSVKSNIIRNQGEQHFGSRGKCLSFGSKGDFAIKDGVSLGEYAEKHTKKSSQCKDKVRMKLAHVLHDACRAVDKIVPNGTILTTSHVEAMKGKLNRLQTTKAKK